MKMYGSDGFTGQVKLSRNRSFQVDTNSSDNRKRELTPQLILQGQMLEENGQWTKRRKIPALKELTFQGGCGMDTQ